MKKMMVSSGRYPNKNTFVDFECEKGIGKIRFNNTGVRDFTSPLLNQNIR